MPLRPAMLVVRSRRAFAPSVLRQRRLASHDASHHEESHDSTEYPKEGFTSPFWRNIALLTVATVGLLAYAPTELLTGAGTKDVGDAPWLTRILAHYSPSTKGWKIANEKHLEQSEVVAEYTRVVQAAKRPEVHRYRYPLQFEQVSSHCIPVGGMTDLSDLEVRK